MTNGHNGIEKTARPFISEIEGFHTNLAELHAQYMARCKGVRADIKSTLTAAKDAGINMRALKAIIKRRALEKKIYKIPADFDEDETTIYEQLVDAFGALGEAAARAAGFDVDPPPVDGSKKPGGRVRRGGSKPAAPEADAAGERAF
jgi:hypothetical protein